jgi:hypothetical protein
VAAGLTVSAALFLVYGVRLAGRRLPRLLLPVTTIGYAAPGAVLAVGLLIPLAALDQRVADLVLRVTGHDPGLILTGTPAALVLAYCVRFFAIAQGAVDSAFGRVSPSLPMAARSLGRSAGGALQAVYLPLMQRSVATALLVLLIVLLQCLRVLLARVHCGLLCVNLGLNLFGLGLERFLFYCNAVLANVLLCCVYRCVRGLVLLMLQLYLLLAKLGAGLDHCDALFCGVVDVGHGNLCRVTLAVNAALCLVLSLYLGNFLLQLSDLKLVLLLVTLRLKL